MSDSDRLSLFIDQLQARLTAVEKQLAQAEEALRQGEANRRESQDFFTKAFQTIPALMIITRLSDGMLLEANAGFIADQDGYLEAIAAAQRVLIAEAELTLVATTIPLAGAAASSAMPGAGAAPDDANSGM